MFTIDQRKFNYTPIFFPAISASSPAKLQHNINDKKFNNVNLPRRTKIVIRHMLIPFPNVKRLQNWGTPIIQSYVLTWRAVWGSDPDLPGGPGNPSRPGSPGRPLSPGVPSAPGNPGAPLRPLTPKQPKEIMTYIRDPRGNPSGRGMGDGQVWHLT